MKLIIKIVVSTIMILVGIGILASCGKTLSGPAAEVLDQRDWNTEHSCWVRDLGGPNEKFASCGGGLLVYVTETQTENGERHIRDIFVNSNGKVSSMDMFDLKNNVLTKTSTIISDDWLSAGTIEDKESEGSKYRPGFLAKWVEANYKYTRSNRSPDDPEIAEAQKLVDQKRQDWALSKRQ